MKTEVLFDENALNKIIEKLASQIAEQYQDGKDVVIVGVQRGGVYLAERLKVFLKQKWGCDIPTGAIDIGMYRDDLNQHLPPTMHPSMIPVDINDKNVILVDDVLFSGRTTRAALDALNDFGRPSRVQLAVLIDRGHRELPIKADFIGTQIQTAKEDKVIVQFKESDGADKVVVERVS
ncbi:MAG: bifunctional pyr operon transcriptional regulator/uracil phosphoribosyltransferase PyrR [Verrucomicrobiia bacterium]